MPRTEHAVRYFEAAPISRAQSWRWRTGVPGGTLVELADTATLIDAPGDLRTPLVGSYEAVVWHGVVSHPKLAVRPGDWESLAAAERQ